ILKDAEIRISMDGRSRFYDNIFVERLWRTVKYEEVYLNDYISVPVARKGLGDYFSFYNIERPHASLAGKTPFEVYYGVSTAQDAGYGQRI
ncbi:MAG: integrase core domain-containing protein, partial [Candidatus Aminicenantaceae bacterium]